MRSMWHSLWATVVGAAVLALLAGFGSAAIAQRGVAPYRVGVLNDARAANHPSVEGLKAGLRELGFEEGEHVVFDVRVTDGQSERLQAAASALVKSGVDLIFSSGDAATLAAMAATQTIPVVFTGVGDPLAAGIVKSYSAPAGNLTGVSSLTSELLGKRLELLKQLAPGLRRVWAVAFGADPALTAAITRAGELGLGIELIVRSVGTATELERLLEALRPGDALLVPDIGAIDLSAALLEVSLARRIPAVFSAEIWISHGGLVAYGADYRAMGVQAARLVGKVLRGARPRELPVEGAERIVLALNLKTAASLGLRVPRTLLFRADIIRR